MGCCKKFRDRSKRFRFSCLTRNETENTGCCNWGKNFLNKHKATLDKAKQLWDFLTLLLFLTDIATDGFASYCYYLLGDVWWATLTLCFMFPAMISASLNLVYHLCIKDADSWPAKCFWVLVAVSFAPLITICDMAREVYFSIVKKDTFAAKRAGFMKLTEGVLESGPQCFLQAYILFQYLEDETKEVGILQYLTLTVSILSLAIGISNYVLFSNSKIIIRITFFVFGTIALVSKLLICCIFSLYMKPLYLLPICTCIVISIIIWIANKTCNLSHVPRDEYIHACKIGNIAQILLTIVVCGVFNSFTLSSLPMALFTLSYAIAGYFLVPGTIAIITITLAALALVANIMLVSVQKFKVVGKTWLADMEERIWRGTDDGEFIGSFFY